MSTPVLIVAYSRHKNVIQLINSLHSQGVQKIYLAIDGSKDSNNDVQVQMQSSSQALASKLGLDLRIWRRLDNLGPAVSVITAIDWFFSQEEEGIILEDDLILSSSAIAFFRNSLTRYATEKNVLMVSGSNYFEEIQGQPAKLATHYPVIWGWATWADRWKGYRTSIMKSEYFRLPGTVSERWFWKIGVRRCFLGIKDAWDIPLAAYQLSIGSVSVLPPVNLISNCGADEFAGNTFLNQWPLNVQVKLLDQNHLIKIDSDNNFFRDDDILALDSMFREKIFGIHFMCTLPPVVSKFLDFLRYPVSTRMDPLMQRLQRVIIPT